MKNNVSVSDLHVKNDDDCVESLAEERAQRARLVRRMTGLTRVALAKKYGVSSANFQNWEGPRYGGLTEKAAMKLVAICSNEGIEISVEWLMYGSGAPPTIMPPAHYRNLQLKETEKVYAVVPSTGQEINPHEKRSMELAKIAQELEVFKQNYEHDVLVTVVTDKVMEPYYKLGDYIAGKRHTNISAFLQSECIVEMADRKLVVRVLQPGNEEHKYNLAGYNTVAQATVMRNVKILSVAPVMWIRRLGQE